MAVFTTFATAALACYAEALSRGLSGAPHDDWWLRAAAACITAASAGAAAVILPRQWRELRIALVEIAVLLGAFAVVVLLTVGCLLI